MKLNAQILKALKESISQNNSDTLEIFNNPELTSEIVDEFWPDNLTYKGTEFFDKLYMGKIIPKAEEYLGLDEESKRESRRRRREGLHFDFDDDYEEPDGQESYLGYIPSKDIFISGWDTQGNLWRGNMVALEIDNGNVYVKESFKLPSGDGLMYPYTYKQLHQMYPEIIDIRLD